MRCPEPVEHGREDRRDLLLGSPQLGAEVIGARGACGRRPGRRGDVRLLRSEGVLVGGCGRRRLLVCGVGGGPFARRFRSGWLLVGGVGGGRLSAGAFTGGG
jgi:hypothetical protein